MSLSKCIFCCKLVTYKHTLGKSQFGKALGYFQFYSIFLCKDCFSLSQIPTQLHTGVLNDLTVTSIICVFVGGNTSVFVWKQFVAFHQFMSTPLEGAYPGYIYSQCSSVGILTNITDISLSCDWTALFSSPFSTEPVRFSAVVANLTARAPEVFCRKLCVYLVCVTGAVEMAGIMGFIYVHTHLHCPVSGTLTRGTHSC